MKIKENYSLERHNTFRLPVETRWFIEYDNEEELLRILHDEYFRESASVHIGSGSNLLFLNDYNGMILHSSIKGIDLTEETRDTVRLRIGAAERWDDVVAYAVSKGWYGIENLSGIPGETGAAAVQNIGAYGVELKDVVETVEAYHQHSSQKHTFTKEACRYAYRHSRFKEDDGSLYIVTHICIRLSKIPHLVLHYGNLKEIIISQYATLPHLSDVRNVILSVRKDKLPDPEQFGNAGSFFMNPLISAEHVEALKVQYPQMPFFRTEEGDVKIPAGWLIEQCGFKGKSFDRVGVYDKQALVLINLGGATGQDIALVAERIRTAVAERFRIELIPEVKYIG
ncbi:MAG: UDP-N-acetylmuramate dehydrogenase [Tannerellaceae bacterium]|jgi:UDP-N-acetylmuramate dehydrogenase|nr:UDP-N-acetylmuramate dehydrogenase [Tannerellaceae bacterium]